jgi:hypothetical protein
MTFSFLYETEKKEVTDQFYSLPDKYFEDAVVHESGVYKETQGIVTRDFDGFKKSKINKSEKTSCIF